jgi:uncharacterized protein (DUF362 family)
VTDLNDLRVAITQTVAAYPEHAPFHPPEHYPECPHSNFTPDSSNKVYAAVRETLRTLGLDAPNYGTPEWNPLGEIVRPGNRVLLKPNFVQHFNGSGGPLEAVVTHGAVIRAVADYVLIALRGSGELIIGDAPQMNCDWVTLTQHIGADEVASYLQEACDRKGVSFRFVDFRHEQVRSFRGIVWTRTPLNDRATRTVKVVLGPESMMQGIENQRLYGADYNRDTIIRAHEGGRHEYLVATEVLQSEVIISLPKLKSHSKVGTTLNIKNMVGINTDKNHLAHYRVGSPAQGGDEFSSTTAVNTIERKLMDTLLANHWNIGKYPFLGWRMIKRVIKQIAPPPTPVFTGGNWHGNDTAWRMALDLNRVLLFADRNGKLQNTPARRYFSLIDGIVGGQGDGPLYPEAAPAGVLVAGFNPLAVDWTATKLMGFDPNNIKMYAAGVEQFRALIGRFDESLIEILSATPGFAAILSDPTGSLGFAPPPGWRGAMELTAEHAGSRWVR